MFFLKTADGGITLDGHLVKEFKGSNATVKELTDAYPKFGLKK